MSCRAEEIIHRSVHRSNDHHRVRRGCGILSIITYERIILYFSFNKKVFVCFQNHICHFNICVFPLGSNVHRQVRKSCVIFSIITLIITNEGILILLEIQYRWLTYSETIICLIFEFVFVYHIIFVFLIFVFLFRRAIVLIFCNCY